MSLIPNPLEDFEPIPEGTSTSQELEREAEEPASVLSVKMAVSYHVRTCPALRKLRQWAMVACMLIGVVLAFQFLIAAFGRTVLKDVVREAIKEERGHPTMAAGRRSPWLVPEAAADSPKLEPERTP
jgi:hypothetical protein